MESPAPGFDLQAHRGGLGLTVENTLAAFGTALDTGVTTLELDVHISADGVAMVTHDRQVSAAKCVDTGPAWAEDPAFPYVGKYVARLTHAQLRTLDCGSLTLAGHPRQQAVPGARMPTLAEMFELVDRRGASEVRLNIETKYETVAPFETAPQQRFVQVVSSQVRAAGLLDRVSVQSFDWGLLRHLHEVEPALRRYGLTSGHYLEVGGAGASPWLGGLDIDDFDGNLVRLAAHYGFDAVSPIHGDPLGSGVRDPAYRPFVTAAMVADAHDRGLRVIPYTVDDPATMRALIELGVDGLITNYPDVLRVVMSECGLPLPASHRPRSSVEPVETSRSADP